MINKLDIIELKKHHYKIKAEVKLAIKYFDYNDHFYLRFIEKGDMREYVKNSENPLLSLNKIIEISERKLFFLNKLHNNKLLMFNAQIEEKERNVIYKAVNSNRLSRGLKPKNIAKITVREVMHLQESDFKAVKGCGKVRLAEINIFLDRMNNRRLNKDKRSWRGY